MFEITMSELGVFVALGFVAGAFTSVFASRWFEVVHTWHVVQEVVISLLLMCAKIAEDSAFLAEVKKKHMREAGFTPEQIREYEKVDEVYLTNWRDSVIVSMVARAPRHFRGMLPFENWRQAMAFLNDAMKRD